VCCGTL